MRKAPRERLEALENVNPPVAAEGERDVVAKIMWLIDNPDQELPDHLKGKPSDPSKPLSAGAQRILDMLDQAAAKSGNDE